MKERTKCRYCKAPYSPTELTYGGGRSFMVVSKRTRTGKWSTSAYSGPPREPELIRHYNADDDDTGRVTIYTEITHCHCLEEGRAAQRELQLMLSMVDEAMYASWCCYTGSSGKAQYIHEDAAEHREARRINRSMGLTA